ncbi:MAG TPA: LLM class flavin-dependent oxidoreductase, partial [Thermomicrobiales bacterium]|nr:LLM class flavin-dependent oxidoreductase [Thermomicrobiales bacterium]
MPSRPLSFLDLTPIESGSTATAALAQSVALAQEAEALGFHRIWYAEHHNSAGMASSSPELMIAHVADRTNTIRLGSGGVMLPNHAPLKINETFRLLEVMHPGRVDLGLGRAPGTDTVTAFAMRRTPEALRADNYPELVTELLAFDDGTFNPDHPFRKITPVPADTPMPPIYLLGSSDFTANLAAHVGLGFGFAAHISRAMAIPAMLAYRNRFQPSRRYPQPYAILTVSVTIGETEAHAADLTLINRLFLLRLRTGQLGQFPTLAEARAYQFSESELALIESMPLNFIAGTAEQVAETVARLADATQADEIMITTTPQSLLLRDTDV